ncbi:Frataxin-like protein [Scheffersomyces xylosifermentans]|uniref:Frataxin-like protein n=1 Tax=Scheffersomyces xylosifermentans TaxID=1304137 RepID=UPI00315D92D3
MYRQFASLTARTVSSALKSRCGPLMRNPRALVLAGSRYGSLSRVGTMRFYSLSTEGENFEDKIDNISINEYNTISEEYLESLADSLEDLSENYPQIDCELSHGVMTLTIPPNGTYVINKQPPNKQIWLSSPISGPKRYDLIQGKWVTLRDGSSLTALLAEEVSSAVGAEVEFDLEN